MSNIFSFLTCLAWTNCSNTIVIDHSIIRNARKPRVSAITFIKWLSTSCIAHACSATIIEISKFSCRQYLWLDCIYGKAIDTINNCCSFCWNNQLLSIEKKYRYSATLVSHCELVVFSIALLLLFLLFPTSWCHLCPAPYSSPCASIHMGFFELTTIRVEGPKYWNLYDTSLWRTWRPGH